MAWAAPEHAPSPSARVRSVNLLDLKGGLLLKGWFEEVWKCPLIEVVWRGGRGMESC